MRGNVNVLIFEIDSFDMCLEKLRKRRAGREGRRPKNR